jgi:outer membrane protein TolC
MLRLAFRAALAVPLGALALICRADEPASAPQTPENQPPPLTIDQSVAQALAKNFSVRIQVFSVSSAKDAVIVAQSAYDPLLGITWQKTFTQYSIAASALNSAAGGAPPVTSSEGATASVTQPVITGGTVTANYGLSRSSDNSVFSILNPTYNGQASLTVTQPLLQGGGADYNRALIRNAELGARIAGLNFKSTVLATIYNVETAYFSLISARRQHAVARDTLKLAQELLDENVIKRKTGVLTDLDVVQAQAGVATAASQLIGYKLAADNAEDVLLQALGEREFKARVGPVFFPDLPSADASFDVSYKLARDNGPSLAIIEATIEQYKLDALRAKRSNLPQLNATAGVGYLNTETSYSAAAATLWNGSGYTWNAGLTLSVPWGMRATRAQYRQAMYNVESESVALDQADQNLMVQVRSAVRSVQSSLENVTAAAQAATLSQKQYELQKAKFDAGLATSYDVLQAQDQLETTRVSEVQAEANLRIALANLHFLEGTSLGHYHVNLD